MKKKITDRYEQQVQRTVSSPIPTIKQQDAEVLKTASSSHITEKYLQQVEKTLNSPIPKPTQVEKDELKHKVIEDENGDECYHFSNLTNSTISDLIEYLKILKEVHTLDLTENSTLGDQGIQELTKFLADEKFTFKKLIFNSSLYSAKYASDLTKIIKNRSDKPEVIDRVTITITDDNYEELLKDNILNNNTPFSHFKYVYCNVTKVSQDLFVALLDIAKLENMMNVTVSNECLKRAEEQRLPAHYYLGRIDFILDDRHLKNCMYDLFTSPWTYTALAGGTAIVAVAIYNPPAAAIIVGAATVGKLAFEGYKYCTSNRQIADEGNVRAC